MKEVYALENSPEEVNKSSSGGAFILICNEIESKYGEGKVTFYGACFDSEMNVIYSRVTSSKECAIFQGSKYVKSNLCNILNLIEEDLLNDKIVLFSGTPCHIYSVKTYIEKKNLNKNNFFAIDIICHGTPSVEFWNSYKKWLENKHNSKLINYSFRYKPEGWKAYPAYAEFENGKKEINTADTSIYSRLHMKGLITTEGCFNCPFSNEKRIGDITLGDYWGIDEILPEFPNKEKGVSLVIVNTDRGNEILSLLKKTNREIYLEKTNNNCYLKYQHNLKEKTNKPNNYKSFWEDFNNISFENLLKKYLNYGFLYKAKHNIKKIIRKTFIIEFYRKLRDKIKRR